MTTYVSHMSLLVVRAAPRGRLDAAGNHFTEGTTAPGTVMTRAITYVVSCCTLGPVLHRYRFSPCLYQAPPADPWEPSWSLHLQPFVLHPHPHYGVPGHFWPSGCVTRKGKRSSPSSVFIEDQVHGVGSDGLCYEFIHPPVPLPISSRAGSN